MTTQAIETSFIRRTRSTAWLRERRLLLAAMLLFCLCLLMVAGPSMHDPVAQDATARLLTPSADHPFGTDELRRDILSRVAVGLRMSLTLSFGAVLAGATLGTVSGMVAGYAGGFIESVIMRIVDAWLAFPGLLAAIAVLTIVGPGALGVGVALALFVVPVFARMARAQTMAEREKDYVRAAVAIGASPQRVVARHIAINAAPALMTQLALALTAAIRIEAGLSFLGLGTRPPSPSLGGMISSAQPYLRDAPSYLLFPALVLGLLLYALTLLADSIGDRLNGR